ncbi:MAG: class II glutamine amidotransferase [Thermoplasmata archaeon]
MCRLFGLLGRSDRSVADWLAGPDRSLISLADLDARRRQGEGWGIAWFDPQRSPSVRKGIGCASDPEEAPRFRDAAADAAPPLVIGHLRRASNPMGLAREALLGYQNSQPFVRGSTLFAHNGAIPLPNETRPLTGAYRATIEGVNDSEVLFCLLLRHLESEPDPPRAYARTVADLRTVWEAHGRPVGAPYSGLNVLLARGPHELWAFCHSLGEHGTGLRDDSVPYYQMTYRAERSGIVVASERLTDEPEGWRALRDGEYLVAQEDRGSVRFRTGTIPFGPAQPASSRIPA